MRKNIINSLHTIFLCALLLFQSGIIKNDERIFSFSRSYQDITIFPSICDFSNLYYDNSQQENARKNKDSGSNDAPFLEHVVYSYLKKFNTRDFYLQITATVEQEYLRSSDLKYPPYKS